jgi:hypothetical protein
MALLTPVTSIKAIIRPHWPPTRAVDVSRYVTFMSRSKSLLGDTVGTWSLSMLCEYRGETDRFIESTVRPDDWIDLMIKVDGVESWWTGMVDSTGRGKVTQTGDGGLVRSWRLAGRDWAKAMVTGSVKVGCIFSSSLIVPQQDASGALTDSMFSLISALPKIPAALMSGEALSPELQSAQEFMTHPRIPGVIDQQLWDQIVAATFTIGRSPWIPIAAALELALWKQWQDPDGVSLLEKLGTDWPRFGKFASREVEGEVWQLPQLMEQRELSPHQMLQSYGNPAFNEVFYAYREDDPRRPAIVFRERPYAGDAWQYLVDHRTRVTTVAECDPSRSDSERITYRMPRSVIAGMNGVDQLIDTRDGRLPMVDMSQISRHGLRTAEPADDYNIPTTRADADQLAFFIDRARRWRIWTFNAPEYLTGTASLSHANTAVRIGTAVELPVEATFRRFDGVIIEAPTIVAYAVGVDEQVRIDPRGGGATSSMTISFTRGQPLGGLPVPNEDTWL